MRTLAEVEMLAFVRTGCTKGILGLGSFSTAALASFGVGALCNLCVGAADSFCGGVLDCEANCRKLADLKLK